ncbi:excinuclease ATPase subunit [Simiduia curdlanivorans]|uniref:Excinuclease ATPase subunit n=1 Tax=Simiduia curdlanivorans TaxID=1492769 RepID=A0ABV8V4Y7_9GAMM|nr:excinuclease ATPase subunit [Simiduia curdlanivorans]MDN3640810.1 excinuclease ATPase subunit [Simiduia curdlanivorans]
MKKLVICLLAALTPLAASARDTAHFLPIETALAAAKASGKLDGGVKLYFADQPYAGKEKDLGTFTTSKKTNSFGKSDEDACKWAMQSALIELQTRAIKEGGDAVVNIESFYKKKAHADTETYECHAGNVVAGVALRGTVIKLKQ